MTFSKRIRAVTMLMAAAIGLGTAAPLVAQSTGTIRGKVTEAGTQRPLNGVQVSIPGTTRGALTNAAGDYMVVGVPAGTHTVRAQMIGYTDAATQVTVGAGETARADLQLGQAAIELDALVVTGTAGATQKRAIGNAVTSVDAAQIAEVAPVNTVTQLLTARAPGLTIMSPSGTPGTAGNITIRGVGSLSAGNQPVFYIDGVRMSAGSQGGWSVSGQSTSALDAINPDDIESIEVIKGPAAATLYGAEAASGVIQIITKRGRAGQQGIQWNAKATYGESEWTAWTPTNWTNCSNARVRTAGNGRTGSYPGCAGIDTLAVPVDSEGRLISANLLRDDPRALRTADIRGYNLSARGGGEAYSFYFSGDREEEQGVFHNSQFERTSGRANFQVNPSEKLDISVSTQFARTDTRLPNNDNSSWGMLRNVIRSPAGRQGPYEIGYLGLGPDQINAYDNQTRAERVILGSTVNYRPFDWFSHRLTAGLDMNERLATLFFPIDRTGTRPYGTTNARGFIGQYAPNTRTYTLDYAGTISNELPRELTSALSFGMQLNAYRFESLQANGTGLVSNRVRLVSNAEEREAFESFSEQNSLGFFVQEQLGWRNRLFVTGAVRVDDNSAFGDQFETVVYPKLSASWVVSEEPFFRLPAVDQLRLRAAWGMAGNSPGPFDADRTYGVFTTLLADGTPAGGLEAESYGNPNLKAETGEEYEVGFEASMFENRLGLDLTYYNKTTKDALMSIPVAPSTGFAGSRLANVGEINNQGLEVSLFGTPVATQAFTWDARLGIATNRNELVTFGGARDEDDPITVGYRSSQRHAVGYPLAGYWAYPVARDESGELILAPQGWAALADELEYVGPSRPTREASLTNTFTVLGNLQLYTFLDYKGGHYLLNMTQQTRDWGGYSWEMVNPATSDEERAIRDSDSNLLYMEEADFVKLREVALTYNVPSQFTGRFGTERLSVTLSGRNLATWTDYTGSDPEVNIAGDANFTRGDYMSVPPLRRLVAEVNVSF